MNHSSSAAPVTPPESRGEGAPAGEFYRPGQYRADQSVGYLMRRVLTSILAQGDRQLAQHGLTHAQWLPLYKLLANENAKVAQMARDLGIDPGAMTRSLDRLESKGLIERQRSSEDRRVVNLRLTPEGQGVAEKVPAVMAEVLNAHLAGFTHEEWQQLTGLLRRMVDNAEKLRAGPDTPGSPG
jgi:DNA-binding MarR family transcriptional regulator